MKGNFLGYTIAFVLGVMLSGMVKGLVNKNQP